MVPIPRDPAAPPIPSAQPLVKAPDPQRTARLDAAAIAHPHRIACPGFVRISDMRPDPGQNPDIAGPRRS
jgi:hypothetical protein